MGLSGEGRGRGCEWTGMMGGRGKASRGRRGGPCLLGLGASVGAAGSEGTGEMGAWFGANDQVGGSEDGEEEPEEARREAARMVTGSPGSPKSPLEAKSLDSPCPKPSLAFAIWLDDSGTTPGEKAVSILISPKTWKMSTFNSSG